MINIKHLRTEIIHPALKALNMWSLAAENLILGTCAQESQLGYFLRQIDNGPALGIYQIEPATFADIWERYLGNNNPELQLRVMNACNFKEHPTNGELIYNLRFATMICRIRYWMKPESLPNANDIEGLAYYWKQHYNTIKGKGTTEEFVENYRSFIV